MGRGCAYSAPGVWNLWLRLRWVAWGWDPRALLSSCLALPHLSLVHVEGTGSLMLLLLLQPPGKLHIPAFLLLTLPSPLLLSRDKALGLALAPLALVGRPVSTGLFGPWAGPSAASRLRRWIPDACCRCSGRAWSRGRRPCRFNWLGWPLGLGHDVLLVLLHEVRGVDAQGSCAPDGLALQVRASRVGILVAAEVHEGAGRRRQDIDGRDTMLLGIAQLAETLKCLPEDLVIDNLIVHVANP
mmetsp:Transcript_28718/g.45019  ORF Transcript_28718/g.45019 Transcript_28718/m.45019 type:complete len:242 (+) Transcript_28718:818-1543(+)